MSDSKGFLATAAAQPVFWKVVGTVVVVCIFLAVLLVGRVDVFEIIVDGFVEIGDALAKVFGR